MLYFVLGGSEKVRRSLSLCVFPSSHVFNVFFISERQLLPCFFQKEKCASPSPRGRPRPSAKAIDSTYHRTPAFFVLRTSLDAHLSPFKTAANPRSFTLVPTASRGITAPISQARDAVTFLPIERRPEKKKKENFGILHARNEKAILNAPLRD